MKTRHTRSKRCLFLYGYLLGGQRRVWSLAPPISSRSTAQRLPTFCSPLPSYAYKWSSTLDTTTALPRHANVPRIVVWDNSGTVFPWQRHHPRRHQQQHHDTALQSSALSESTEHFLTWGSMSLLALQFGAMPTLQKRCVSKQLCRSSMVLAQELSKLCLSSILLSTLLPSAHRGLLFQKWTIQSWWTFAGIPATLYAIQNYAKLMAYQHLPPVTYAILNQTKTLSTALCCYLMLGQYQTKLQILSLGLLLLSALILEQVVNIRKLPSGRIWHKPSNNKDVDASTVSRTILSPSLRNGKQQQVDNTSSSSNVDNNDGDTSDNKHSTQSPRGEASAAAASSAARPAATATLKKDPHHFSRGVLPLLIANLTSGLGGALGQRALQQEGRNLLLYNMELSAASAILILMSLVVSKDGQKLRQEGVAKYWTKATWIPIGIHAITGLLVAIVTKYAGSVQKGFALIFGVLLSGIFQKWYLANEPITVEQIAGAILACTSLWMYSSFPAPR